MTITIADEVLDARGLMCPMPVVRTGLALRNLETGKVLKVLVSDPAASTDFPAWVEDVGHELAGSSQEPDGTLVFYVRKGDGIR